MSIRKEDLGKYDFYLLIDRSTSMGERLKAESELTKWENCKELAEGVAREAANYDDDGITLIFFASEHMAFENIGGGSDKELALKQLHELFQKHGPNGTTNTGGALKYVFDGYLKRKRESKGEAKPILLIVVTDGRPDSEAEVKRNIVDFTQHLDYEDEAGIQFLQIGNNDGAREFLENLDKKLKGAKFDIVATRNMSELDNMTLTDILLTAVND